MSSITETPLDDSAAKLRDALGSRVILAGDADYDAVRSPWNVAVDQRPFAVVIPESAEEVVAVVRAATAAGLRVAAQSTGHAAPGLSETDLSDVVLVRLTALRGVTVHPEARAAIVLGGSHWNDVIAAAAPYGLTALHGSAGDVSVAGYSLNGGVSFYARAHGLGVNAVRAVQIVTADGSLVRASAHQNADLFWAVRGGSGSFGIVVSLEIDLLPYADVFAGMLLWDASHTAAVSRAWAAWTASVPESVTSTLRVLHLPPLPELPPFLSGRSVVVVDGAVLESDARADELLRPLRDLAPEIDTFGRIPSAALVQVHMDPPQPTPAVTRHRVLDALPDDAVAAFVAASADPGLFVAELRHVGGAAARPVPGGGAVSAVAGEYIVHSIAVPPVPEALPGALTSATALVDAFEPWAAETLALTFLDGGMDRAPGFGASLDRLRALKAHWDPRNVFAAANPV
ncbi:MULTISPECIES: FAD-binding oxidoreductase [Microbacterium]|jgi:FAD/FMN-containing dehydrogenase|uniref:FAD-binding oxidoreductase n=1 Tax=Microbacterium TaxID=33882 RepID=UPI001D17C8BD|nr:FAD-binding oxidoreductase [Microbacterium testaceum]MCC4250562.1 FAD-binding oxidoreductase [Microbacterium testaceum]